MSSNSSSGDYDLRSLHHERRMLAVYRRQSSHDPSVISRSRTRAGGPRLSSGRCTATRSGAAFVGRAGETLARASRAASRASTRAPNSSSSPPLRHRRSRARSLHHAHHVGPEPARRRAARGQAFRPRAHTSTSPKFTRSSPARSSSRSRTRRARPSLLWKPRAPRPTAAGGAAVPTRSTRAWRVRRARGGLRAAPRRSRAAWRKSLYRLARRRGRARRRRVRSHHGQTLAASRASSTRPDHHPKLYVWLPGSLSLCALARERGLPHARLAERHEREAEDYARLPPELLYRRASER